jgi:hypothetical protein
VVVVVVMVRMVIKVKRFWGLMRAGKSRRGDAIGGGGAHWVVT